MLQKHQLQKYLRIKDFGSQYIKVKVIRTESNLKCGKKKENKIKIVEYFLVESTLGGQEKSKPSFQNFRKTCFKKCNESPKRCTFPKNYLLKLNSSKPSLGRIGLI
jgi:hypothetical protein